MTSPKRQDSQYPVIKLTPTREGHPFLKKKRSVMGSSTAQKQKMKNLKDANNERLSLNQQLLNVKAVGWTM